MKKTLSIVLSVLLMGIFSPAFANSIKWSMPGDSLTLDPHAQNEGPTHMVSRQIYEGLVTPGINMEVLPQLAESWTTTADDTWIFNIRRGVTFHDGSSLTAGDVAFSVNRAKTAPSDMVDLIKSVKSARAIDDHTVEIKTDGPNPILLNQLTQIFVMSEAWSKANGCEASYNWDAGETSYCASNANGTGPFEITFREQDVRTVFEKNDNWWGNHYTHNIDKIELLPIKNDATIVAALLSGEIDYTNVVPVQDIQRINSSMGHAVKMTPQNRTIFFEDQTCNSIIGDSLNINYRVLPFDIEHEYFYLDSTMMKVEDQAIYIGSDYSFTPKGKEIIDAKGLDYNGSFSRGFSVGNSQSRMRRRSRHRES